MDKTCNHCEKDDGSLKAYYIQDILVVLCAKCSPKVLPILCWESNIDVYKKTNTFITSKLVH